MFIHGLTETEARFIALAVDTHDKPATSTELRIKIRAELVRRTGAPNHTEALKKARAIRKACVHRRIYTRPKNPANPRPKRSPRQPWRTAT